MPLTQKDIMLRRSAGLPLNPALLTVHAFGGDPPAPTAVESMDQTLEAYNKWIGPLSEKSMQYLPQFEQSLFNVQQQQAPQIAALQSQLYSQYAPEMNRVGRGIADENALSQVALDKQLLGQSGDLVQSYRQQDQLLNPEYYQQVGRTSDLMNALSGEVQGLQKPNANAIDLSGQGLMGGEREEIQRYLNRENNQRGNLTSGDPLTTIGNAMNFGQAGRKRQVENMMLQESVNDSRLGREMSAGGFKANALSQALSAIAPSMQGLKSSADVFKLATGKQASPDYAATKFTGIPEVGNAYFNQNANLLGQAGSFATQQNQINSQRRDSLDRVNETIGSLPSYS